jgi:clan AA aspartic protease (TIGR02281 family)
MRYLEEESGERQGGGAVGWAVRTAGLCCILGTGAAALMMMQTRQLPHPPAPAVSIAKAAAAAVRSNTQVYRDDRSGHYLVDGTVNGAPTRMLVDTGATFVVLSLEDARAAGIDRARLSFTERVTTANGEAPVARTTLRELRLGQLSVEQVPAMVVDAPLHVSLLGMSFLSRLDGYTIREGVLTLEW